MRIVTDGRVARFVGEQVGEIIVPPFTVMGIEDATGAVIAGVVFNHFTGHDVHVTIAGRGWTKGFLADVGHYLFDTLKVCRVTSITEQAGVARLAARLGGRVEGLMTDHFGKGRDAYVIGILRDDWRF